MHAFRARLLREHRDLMSLTHPGIDTKPPIATKEETESQDRETLSSTPEIMKYIFYISFQNHDVYENEVYQLSIEVTDEYPFGPPIVKFVNNIPVHPHIYLNGHICLNILGDDWTPACTLESCVLSIQSMLMNNTISERPPDDDLYTKRAPVNPLRTKFAYHEDV